MLTHLEMFTRIVGPGETGPHHPEQRGYLRPHFGVLGNDHELAPDTGIEQAPQDEGSRSVPRAMTGPLVITAAI